MFSSDIAKYHPTFSLMSFNVRNDIPEDGEDSWPPRKPDVISFIQTVKPNIFGLQEPLPYQLADFKEGLPDYDAIGEPRTEEGEYNPILFNKNLFRLIDSDTFWLSDNPEKPGSKYEEAMFPRICTWGQFEWKSVESTNTPFFLLNTHLDHLNSIAREKQIRVIVEFIKNKIPHDSPTILMGDFNGEDADPCLKYLANTMIFREASTTANKSITATTFTGFDEQGRLTIDHIFYRGFQVYMYAVLKDRRKNERLLSDHRPIVCLLRII